MRILIKFYESVNFYFYYHKCTWSSDTIAFQYEKHYYFLLCFAIAFERDEKESENIKCEDEKELNMRDDSNNKQ